VTVFADLAEQVPAGELDAVEAAGRLLDQLTVDERLWLLDGGW
jgi:hypothetical protein